MHLNSGSLKVRARLLAAAFCVLPVARSQSSNTIFGSGYLRPVPISIAPGQIVNLFVQGVGTNLTGPVAAVGLPLPTSLAGISVVLQAPFPALVYRSPQKPYAQRGKILQLWCEMTPVWWLARSHRGKPLSWATAAYDQRCSASQKSRTPYAFVRSVRRPESI